jgi:DNA polymerase III alpha subunit (gram-positive type)
MDMASARCPDVYVLSRRPVYTRQLVVVYGAFTAFLRKPQASARMPPYDREHLVVFDVESSGLNVETERILSISACVTSADGVREVFDELVNPGVLIPASASKINRIYDETVEHADRFVVVGPRFLDWVYQKAGARPVLCAYNGTNFDFQILFYELRRHCNTSDVPEFDQLRCVDPYVVAKSVLTYEDVPNYRQTSVYEHLFGAPPAGQHSSLGDTEALEQIVNHDLFASALWGNVRRLKNLKTFLQ